jgi:hypothetical protein
VAMAMLKKFTGQSFYWFRNDLLQKKILNSIVGFMGLCIEKYRKYLQSKRKYA